MENVRTICFLSSNIFPCRIQGNSKFLLDFASYGVQMIKGNLLLQKFWYINESFFILISDIEI